MCLKKVSSKHGITYALLYLLYEMVLKTKTSGTQNCSSPNQMRHYDSVFSLPFRFSKFFLVMLIRTRVCFVMYYIGDDSCHGQYKRLRCHPRLGFALSVWKMHK